MSLNIRPNVDLNDKSPEKLINDFRQLPCTANTGAEVVSISENLDTVKIKIPFNENTTNFMNIIYGGTMYAATDAVYVVMLWYRLGEDYLIIDKSSHVKYLRPGIEDLHATFYLPEDDILTIKQTLSRKKSMTREYLINITDSNGKVVCKITKEIAIRKR